MNIMNIIPFGFIGTGIMLRSISNDTNKKIKTKILNEKIYKFPSELNMIDKQNSIIKIEDDLLNTIKNKHIGYVKINKINKIPVITDKYIFDIPLKKYQIYKVVKYDEVKETITKQILFPIIHNKFILDTIQLKKIKFLFDNTSFTKTSDGNLIKIYEDIISSNIPNFKSDVLIPNNYDCLELESNILRKNSELYLMVTPQGAEPHYKFIIKTISDSEHTIVNDKFKYDMELSYNLEFVSNSFIVAGLLFGLSNFLLK